MEEKEYKDILEFLKENTPMIFDMDKKDLIYDEKSMYYKIYKYIHDLREENKKLRGKSK